MKNEEIIMTGEGKEVMINGSNVEKKGMIVNGEDKNKLPEKPEENGGARKVQKPETVGELRNEIKITTKGGEEKVIKVTPEMDRKLKRLHDFEAEVEVGGKPVKKTAYDLLDMMGSLAKEGLTQEEQDKKIEEIKILHDKLEQKYYAGSSHGSELQGIFNDVVFQGIDMQKELNQATTALAEGGQISVNEIVEKMGGDKGKIPEIIGKVRKQLPLPEGVEAAPVVTIGTDGQITITPAPHGEEEAGGTGPAPIAALGEDGRVTVTPAPGGKFTGGGDGSTDTVEEEKRKINWAKWGNLLLFLIIVGGGAQGWWAKMWEQFAERAR